MKLYIYTLMMICFLFSNCNKKSTTETSDLYTNTSKYVLNLETDSYKVVINKVDKRNFENYRNSHHSEPFLGMKAECISLKELLSIIKDIQVNSIILDNKSLENQFYSVQVTQKTISNIQDSTIKSDIVESLNVIIEKKSFNIDTLMVSIDNKRKFLKHANNTVSDTIISQSRLSQDSIIFENYNLEKILASLSKEFDKTLSLSVEEPQKIDFKLAKSDWNSIKEKMKADLGLAFNINTTQVEKYTVRKDNLRDKN